MFADRKATFKVPPPAAISQEARRSKALDDQKRRRAQKIDSSRQLDLFAHLTLGPSDDEQDDNDNVTNVTPASVVPFLSMMHSQDPSSSTLPASDVPPEPCLDDIQPQSPPQSPRVAKQRTKNKKKRSGKPSKWADKCMYAELLEMSADNTWSSTADGNDGLPTDLETAWVAVAPVPVGKRCLAVTHQSAGIAGIVPNTVLRSRLLGKTLIDRFPSPLPPLTILDCILDANWRDNGILHVLDVIKWKGQDIGDCDAPFRFWWRDTRLAELSQGLPPNISFPLSSDSSVPIPLRYLFPYPTKFVPVPYNTDTSLPALYTQIIPFARSARPITVQVPTASSQPGEIPADGMEMEVPPQENQQVALATVSAMIQSDGLLLYVAEASYEPGTSPLSSWVPITDYALEGDQRVSDGPPQGPLDLFQRLVKQRLNRKVDFSSQPEPSSMEMEV